MKHREEMDFRVQDTTDSGKQQIKHTMMQGKRCNFIVWDLIALYLHFNSLFQASVSCLSSRSSKDGKVREQSHDSVALNSGLLGAQVRSHMIFQVHNQKSSRMCDQLVVKVVDLSQTCPI